MKRTELLARLPLAIVLATSLLAFARALSSDVGLVLSVLALATPTVAVRLDSSLERLARLLSRFAVVVAALAGWALAIAPMLHGERTDDVLRTIGFVLAGCALPLAARKPRADAAVLLACLGLLGIAGLHRAAELRPYVVVAALATAAHLISTVRTAAVRAPSGGGARGRLAPIVASLGLAAVVAGGIALGLPPLQRRLEQAIFRGRVQIVDARSGLSGEDVRVGELQRLQRSDRPVLRLFGPRAQRLRAQLYLRFDGRSWHAVHDASPIEPPAHEGPIGAAAAPMLERIGGALRRYPGVAPEALAAPDAIASRLEPIELDEGLVVAPGGALGVKTEDDVRVDALGLLARTDRRQPEPYAIVHRRALGVADERAPTSAERAGALALPRVVDPRVRALAAKLARADGAPEDAPMLPPRQRVARTEDWVRRAARYSLETPKYASRDVVAELLFDQRVGWCEHFATALALLLRLEDVPTRYVTGFQLDEMDREGEHYLVRDANAHAWVEAWVDGAGWIEADATPATEAESLRPPRPTGAMAWLRARWADLRASLRYGRAADIAREARWPVAIALSLLGLAYVARNEIRRRLAEARGRPTSRAREPLPEAIAACQRELDALFRRLGRPRPSSSGLLEHASVVEAEGLDPSLAAVIRAAIELLHRAAFAGEAPGDALAQARASLRSARKRAVALSVAR